MHPPQFMLGDRLSDWPECFVEVHCCHVPKTLPVKLLIRDYGDRTFVQLLDKLRCSRCGKSPAPVYLNASPHREKPLGGGPAGWSIEIRAKQQVFPIDLQKPGTTKTKLALQLI